MNALVGGIITELPQHLAVILRQRYCEFWVVSRQFLQKAVLKGNQPAIRHTGDCHEGRGFRQKAIQPSNAVRPQQGHSALVPLGITRVDPQFSLA